MHYFLTGFLIGAVAALFFAVSYGFFFLLWSLAQSDVFFTVLKEGYTKAIMKNGKPERFVMRSASHRFRGETNNHDENQWDIIPIKTLTAPPSSSTSPPPSASGWWKKAGMWMSLRAQTMWHKSKKVARFATGLYLLDELVWVGFPPTYSVYRYSFHWSSRVQDPKSDGMVQQSRNEIISHILAPQQEVYFALVEDAKTSELVPVNASIALTIQIVNPYKALFATHQWLKTVINQIEPDAREVIGRYTYEALTLTETDTGRTASNELAEDSVFKARCKTIEKWYGCKIILAQFRSIEPTGKHADEITRTSLRKYAAAQEVKEAEQRVLVAEQRAKEIDILAEATERRLSRELGVVKDLGQEALAIRMMELLPKGLQVLSLDGKMPVLPTLPLQRQQEEKEKNTPQKSTP